MSNLILVCSAVGTDNTWPLGAGASKVAAVARPDDDIASYIIRTNGDAGTGREGFTSATTRGIPTTATISSLTVNTRCYASDSEDYRTFVYSGGVLQSNATTVNVNTAWANGAVSQTQVAWTPALVNALTLQIGINKPTWTGPAGNYVRCTTLYATVAFTLAAPSATTSAATAIGTTTATLNGSINPNGATTQYPVTSYFEWGTTTAYGNTTTPVTGNTGTSSIAASANLTGLVTNTTYHFRMVSTNADNTTNGADQAFTTNTSDVIMFVL